MADEQQQTQADIYKDPRAQMQEGKQKESYLFDDLDKGEVKTHPIVTVLSFLFLVAGLVLPSYYGYNLSEEAVKSDTQIKKLESDVSMLDQQITTEKGKGEAFNKELEGKIESLVSPLYRITWSEVIEELNNVIAKAAGGTNSDRLYTFTSYSASESGEITVAGLTNSYPNVALIIEEIEASDMFADVKFSGTSKSINSDGTTAVPISLSFKLVPEETNEEITTE